MRQAEYDTIPAERLPDRDLELHIGELDAGLEAPVRDAVIRCLRFVPSWCRSLRVVQGDNGEHKMEIETNTGYRCITIQVHRGSHGSDATDLVRSLIHELMHAVTQPMVDAFEQAMSSLDEDDPMVMLARSDFDNATEQSVEDLAHLLEPLVPPSDDDIDDETDDDIDADDPADAEVLQS